MKSIKNFKTPILLVNSSLGLLFLIQGIHQYLTYTPQNVLGIETSFEGMLTGVLLFYLSVYSSTKSTEKREKISILFLFVLLVSWLSFALVFRDKISSFTGIIVFSLVISFILFYNFRNLKKNA